MLCAFLAIPAANPQPPSTTPEPPTSEAQQQQLWAADRDARLGWWREARFGMFVHWGLYSPAGGNWNGTVYKQHYAEWIQNWAAVPCDEYARQMKPLFKPAKGYADQWADLAKDAGMRYAVLTVKHHEGFTLFNSREPYSLNNDITGGTNISPVGRDLAREFADAMRAKGLRAGFYYSLLDWQHPGAYDLCLPAYPRSPAGREHAAYIAYVKAHVHELLTNYGPLCTLWFDFSDKDRQGAAWGAAELMADMRTRQPLILVNNRLYDGLENKKGDYGTPEKYVPPTGLPGMDWEVNHTLNESYGFSTHDNGWKDTTTVVRLLCDIVSKGGNLLLNIGPDAAGNVPEPAQQTLRGVGAWMRSNSEAIYGTTSSPFERLPWGRATQRKGALYLMVFDWPSDGTLIVPMRGAVKAASILGSAEPVTIARAKNRLELRLPSKPPHPINPHCTVIKLDLASEGADAVLPSPFAIYADADGILTLSASLATLTGPSLRIEQTGGKDDLKPNTPNIGYWNDTTAAASWPLVILNGQEGRYTVEADLACADAAAGASVVLDVFSHTLAFTVPATGGWGTYKTVDLGTVTLAADEGTLHLRAKTKPGEAVVNIRALRLVPVKR